MTSSAPTRERAREIVLKHRAGTTSPIAARRSAQMRRSGYDQRTARKRLENRGRMMREVVEHRDAARRRRAVRAGGARRGTSDSAARISSDGQAGRVPDGHRRQRVPDVVARRSSGTRTCAERLALVRSASNTHAIAVGSDVRRAPVGAVGAAPNVSTVRPRRRRERQRLRTVGAEEQPPAARHQIDEAPERDAQRLHVGIDVRVVVLEVADDGDVRQVLQELRRLVEERAVVLVALDDESRPAPRR